MRQVLALGPAQQLHVLSSIWSFSEWLQLYANLPLEFASKLTTPVHVTHDHVPAVRSFKLASEVALMIVFLFQCHPRRLQEHAATLLPLMVKVRPQWRNGNAPFRIVAYFRLRAVLCR